MASQHSAPIRVFLIDDHRSILWGLERLIESGTPAMQVVGSATNHADALQLLNDAEVDVILLDIDLGKENGIDAIPKIMAANASAKVLVLTGLRDKAAHDKAVLAGAKGVVEKEASAQTILTAISKVHEGQLWLDRAAAGRIFVEFSRKSAATPDPEQQKISALTDREREIVAGLANNAGATARTIAETLHISEHTLRNHLTSIYEKLDVANRLELFAYAHKHGLTKSTS